MTLNQLDQYFNSILHKENFSADISLNGIQIQNSSPDSKQIKKVAFAVDACELTAKEAVAKGADVLFVHHGLFWGHCQAITGAFYKRVSSFINNDLALIGYHAPLDANNPYGNNYGLAARLGMKNIEDFATWRGMTLGVKGELPSPLTIHQLAKKLLRPGCEPPVILPFGKKEIRTVGIISGGGSEDVESAVNENLDAFITGDFAHEQYHYAREMEINVIGGGHYETETLGVTLLMEKLLSDFGPDSNSSEKIEAFFIDHKTGL